MQKLSFPNILLFVAPAVAIYSIFVIYPSLRSFLWSVHKWDGLTNMNDMPFKGLLNFRRILFENDSFWIALNNQVPREATEEQRLGVPCGPDARLDADPKPAQLPAEVSRPGL